MEKDPALKETYQEIMEKALEVATGERVFYLPHKSVCCENALTTKIRIVADCSARPSQMSNSINECMYTGPGLQPKLWDIMVRARMASNVLTGDLQKAFLQIGLKTCDRDAFRFLFNINGREEHFRFSRLPSGAEASPFVLGVTLPYHYDQQPNSYEDTLESLRKSTYVDNFMKRGGYIQELNQFKIEATEILVSGKFPVHKWESNINVLESEGMPNPAKILGHS